jgi:hypothetical protein
MAIGLIIKLRGIGADKYDAVQKEMGLDTPASQWPNGLISHVAGPSGRDWVVVDIWQSQAHFDKFMGSTLGPTLAKVGGMPQPELTPFEVHNRYKHG